MARRIVQEAIDIAIGERGEIGVFGKHGKHKGTVFDALTQRIGVPLMPVGVSPELMCDWDWMVEQIADMHPLFEPGTSG